MDVTAAEMSVDELDAVIDYFHDAPAEHLEILGVDPTRLPRRDRWQAMLEDDLQQPYPQRERLWVTWRHSGDMVGFSSVDRVAFGLHAFMHLHIIDDGQRTGGVGSAAVTASLPIFFERLELVRLYCEPNAFNVAPNRTVQRCGFRYVKTHMTVPGPLNYHQAVTRWVFEPRPER